MKSEEDIKALIAFMETDDIPICKDWVDGLIFALQWVLEDE